MNCSAFTKNLSLIHRNPAGHSFSVHRLVQQVLADSMPERDQKLWAWRAIQLVCISFESADRQAPDTAILMSHALVCLEWVLKWGFDSVDSETILDTTGQWLFERPRFGDAGEDGKATLEIRDYLRFFNLRQYALKRAGDFRVIAFKPTGKQFRHSVTVEIAIDSRPNVRLTKLTIARDFIDSPYGMFARDLAKSFLNEIWRPPLKLCPAGFR